MPSSSAYAAPIDLDLRSGQWERGGRVVAGALAFGALMLAALPVLVQLLGVAIVALMWVRDAAKASSRSPRMRLHEDGSVECAALGKAPGRHSASAILRGKQAGAPVGAGSARELFPQTDQSSRAEPAPTGAPGSRVKATGNEAASMVPATLLQATSFLGLTQLRWADSDERHNACMLFPDCIDTDTRHRLRVWLATHRPENPSGLLPAGSTPQ
jgi:hypothetical protein